MKTNLKNKTKQLMQRSEPGQGQKRCDLTVRTFQVRQDSINEEERSVEAVLATEAPVLVFDMSRWEIILEVLLMSGCRIPADGQVPLLDTHDRSTVQRQYGSTREIRVEGDKLIGKNVFSKGKSKDVEHAWDLTREKHLKDNSLGYRVIKYVVIEKDTTVEVEGRNFTAPPDRDLRVAVEWHTKENSICPIGADEEAKNRNDISVIKRKDAQMKKFKEWLTARDLDYEALDEGQRTALRADFDAEVQRTEAASRSAEEPARTQDSDASRTEPAGQEQRTEEPNAKEIAQTVIEGERARVAGIRKLCGNDVSAEVTERCITEGKNIDETREIVLEAIRTDRPSVVGPAIHMGNHEMNRDLLEDSVLLRAGYEDVLLGDKENGEKRAELADKHRDVSLIEVCRFALMLDSVPVPSSRQDMIRAAFATASLSTILGNIANKSLLKGYTTVRETWRDWCSIGSVSDFKTQTRARLTDTGDLEEVGNSGEVGYGSATDEKEQFNIATYAKNFGITRQNIINDDLHAFTKIPRAMGARASRKPGDLVYTHLLANGAMDDGVALFHATHANLKTSSALTKANLEAAVTAFMKQTDKDGQPINVEPRVLLVPPDLWATATQLVKSSTLIIAGDTDSVIGNVNVISDLNLKVVVEPRLSNSNYTGYSATSWYLIGNPNVVDTIEVAFLNGRQQPTLERFNPGPDVMGLIFRVYHDTGVKSLDSRGMVKSNS